MNLLKKGILAILIVGSITSCEDAFEPIDPATYNPLGSGVSEITFSSLSVSAGPDKNGFEDGTYVTVKPIAVGNSTFEVDFGAGGAPVTISNLENASYDYPNLLEEVEYTITVTAQSSDLNNVTVSETITITHSPTPVTSAPNSPTRDLSNVLSIYSNGIDFNDGFVGFRISQAANYANGTAQKDEVTMDSGNSVLQYSRLGSNAASIGLDDNIVVADAYGSGVAATHIHFDLHSDFAVGIDKLKITLVNGSTEYTYNQDLTDGEWIGLDLDLATDFSAPVTQIDEIKFELGAGGTANDAATLNVDNVYLYKPFTSVIVNGDFTNSMNNWKIAGYSDGTTTNSFNSTSDGSWTNYDGSDNGSKTKGAKWTQSTSAGIFTSTNTRYAYQALGLLPNTDYILEYEYAIKDDSATEPEGGRRVIAEILDGHFVDGVDAVQSSKEGPIARHSGTIAEGKFNDSIGTKVLLPFTTNSSGEVSVWIYAITPKDAFVDNVKVYQN